MKTIYTMFFCLLILSCNDSKKKDGQVYLPKSNGNLNTISVVIDTDLWNGSIGESIRATFAAPLNGLPVNEPMFKLHQIPTRTFKDFTRRSRIILKIEKGQFKKDTKILSNKFAKPQKVAVISGKTNQEIIEQIKATKEKIIAAFNKEEVKEKQRRIRLSLLDVKQIKENLGIEIEIASAYRISKSEKDFFWIRKNLSNSKTVEILLYEVPLESISKGDSTVVDFIKIRNETTKNRIPGEDGIYMQIEDAFTPSMFNVIVDNKPTYEFRGLWDMQGFTMGGPFTTYAIEDKVNNRYIVADGYVYAPSLDKRALMFELESIIKSIKIK